MWHVFAHCDEVADVAGGCTPFRDGRWMCATIGWDLCAVKGWAPVVNLCAAV